MLNPAPPPPVVVAAPSAPRYWRDCAEQVLFDHMCALTSWEQEFLQDLLRKGRTLSDRQEAKLRQIAAKTGVPGW